MNTSRDVLCQLGPDHRIRYVSPSAAELFGRAPEAMVGMGPEVLAHPDDLPMIADIARSRAQGLAETVTVVRVLRPDGGVRWVESSGRAHYDAITGELIETIVIIRDITEQRALEERLSREAMTDGLTGLANRRAFDDALHKEWRRSIRDGAPISLVLIDLDHFKAFNDDYGHPAGDACLRAVAAAVSRETQRPGDLTARYGGEELAVILPGADAGGASHVAEGIRRGIEAMGVLHGVSPCGVVTASLGVATAGSSSHEAIGSPEALLNLADGALYRAKAGGRNRVETARMLTAVPDAKAERAA